MNKERAEEIYLASVSIENNFTPISFEKLSAELEREGIKVSSSTLQRWSTSLNWKEKARKKAENLSSVGTAKNIASKDELNTLTNLSKVSARGSKILLDFVDYTLQKDHKTLDEIELVLKITTSAVMMQGKSLEFDKAKSEGEKLSIGSVIEAMKNIKDDDVIEGVIEE